jgi:hypothetical protein
LNLFLESDLLDDKELKFSNDEAKNIKIHFNYDAIFCGEDKKNIALGFKLDTTIVLKTNNRKVKIPNFQDIKKTVQRKFENEEVYNRAYLINQNYYKKIVANFEDYGGKDSPDYKTAVRFLKNNQNPKKLEELFINIDYSKFSIEFEDNSKSHSFIVFDRLFHMYDFRNKNLNVTKIIVPKGFYILDSTQINLKNEEFKILALEKDDIKNKKNAQHNSNPIIILKKNNTNYQKVNENYKIVFKYDDNCPADGYGGIISKNNYFTIQQIFCMDFLFVNSYATFKINENTNNIYLHKYGEEYTDRSNPDLKISPKVWSTKDFKIVKFEDVNEIFLDELRNTQPLK